MLAKEKYYSRGGQLVSISWGWVRTTNCLGACSCESVSHFIWLSLFSSTDFSQSITHRSRRPQLYTLQWESSPNTATTPTPLPSSMNTNKTSLVRFCEASLQQASVSEMFIPVVVCCCARRLSQTHHYASQIKQIVLLHRLFASIWESSLPKFLRAGRVGNKNPVILGQPRFEHAPIHHHHRRRCVVGCVQRRMSRSRGRPGCHHADRIAQNVLP